MPNLNYEEAKKVAYNYLSSLSCDYELALLEEKTLTKEFGWVFFYNTKKYVESHDFRDMLGGNCPFIVDKDSGELTETGTAHPIEHYIEEYKQSKSSA